MPSQQTPRTKMYVILSYFIGQSCILSWLYPAPNLTRGAIYLQIVGAGVLFLVTIGIIYEWFRALPRLTIKQAVLFMFSIIFLVVEIFAVAFYIIFCLNDASFTTVGRESFTGIFRHGYEFLYYSVTTFTGTGYGDVTPVSAVAKEFASCEMLAGWMISTLMMALLGSKISLFFFERRPEDKR